MSRRIAPILLSALLLVCLLAHAQTEGVAGLDANGSVDALTARLGTLDLPALAQASPFRARAALGAASAVEQAMRFLHEDNQAAFDFIAALASARLDVVEGRGAPESASGVVALLRLTDHPDSEVVVECTDDSHASVTFLCGPVPLATVWVECHESQDAASAAVRDPHGVAAHAAEEIRGPGSPTIVRRGQLANDLILWDDFDPQTQLVVTSNGRAVVVDLAHSALITVRDAIALPGCGEAPRAALDSLAAAGTCSVLAPEAFDAQAWDPDSGVVFAGDVRAAGIPERIGAVVAYRVVPRSEGGIVLAAEGTRSYSCIHLSVEAALEAVRLVIAGEPVAPSDTDPLRLAAARAMGADSADGADPAFYTGDVHSHTFYSDGRMSPVGLALEAAYAGLDYLVISDHNTVAGAQLAARLLGENGVAFPLIVGEEITQADFHANAYPLTEVFPFDLSFEETAATAHAKGAAVQWNHPGFPPTVWMAQRLKIGIADAAYDAWEHYPDDMDRVAAIDGALRPLIGSTDTHSGTFDWLERTLIFGPRPTGEALADAVRSGRAVALLAATPKGLYGPDRLCRSVAAALVEGTALRAAAAERISAMLAQADVPSLVRASRPAVEAAP